MAELIEGVLAAHPVQTWLERLRAADVPAGPVNDIPTALFNPQTDALGLVQTINQTADQPGGGPARVLGLPLRMSAFSARIERPAPLLGQHNAELLKTPDAGA